MSSRPQQWEPLDGVLDDMCDWVASHLTPGQRLLAADVALKQLQQAVNLLADLRVQCIHDMKADGATNKTVAGVLGVATTSLERTLTRARKARKVGGMNKKSHSKHWVKVKREYGQTAQERRDNGYRYKH